MEKIKQREISIEFHCAPLPQGSNLYLGIQQGKESAQDVPCEAGEAHFHFTLRVSGEPPESPNFLGEFAQGPRENRFVYLCWWEVGGGERRAIGRVKIPLTPLSWEEIVVAAQTQKPIRAHICLVDKAGKRINATPNPEMIRWEQR